MSERERKKIDESKFKVHLSLNHYTINSIHLFRTIYFFLHFQQIHKTSRCAHITSQKRLLVYFSHFFSS